MPPDPIELAVFVVFMLVILVSIQRIK